MPSPEAELAGKFWDLANLVAGFSAVQMVAALFAVMHSRLEFIDRLRKVRKWLVLGTVLFNILIYIGDVWVCYALEKELRMEDGQLGIVLDQSWWAAVLRTVWITVFTAMGALAIGRDVVPRT